MSATETITMFYYYDKNKTQVWTSNQTLAFKRADFFESEVYKVEIPVKDPKDSTDGKG